MRTFLNGLLVAVVAVAGVDAVEGEHKEHTIETDALVQVSKYMDQTAFIVNSDFEVVYKVFNTGNKDATNIVINEASFTKAENMPKKYQDKKFTIPKLSPGESVTKTFAYSAGALGTFRPTMSKMSYNNGVVDVTAYTSKPKQFKVLTEEEFDYEYGPKVLEWTVYFLTVAMMIVFPLAMYMGSNSRYVGVDVGKASVLKKQSKSKQK